jgi:hypothetical protein
VAEAEARKDAIDVKIDAANTKLKFIADQIADRDAELAAAIANRNAELDRGTAEASDRLIQLNREISIAEDRLTLTQTSLKKLREHLAAQ